jgi:UDP-N-acetylglucosamine 2-epimerase (non-hydrolysing)
MRKLIVIVIGTRPDAIKLIPLYQSLISVGIKVLLCSTSQHNELLKQVLDIFNVVPDVDFNLMIDNQDVSYVTRSVLKCSIDLYKKYKPSMVVVQGDTTSAFSAALAAFYLKIPISHVEAGLRTGNVYSPFPEEINRVFISKIATYHFAPTSLNVANLLSEKIVRKNIFCVGNTGIDSLHYVQDRIEQGSLDVDDVLKSRVYDCLKQNKKIVLLTAHRRESFDGELLKVFRVIKRFVERYNDVFVFYPMHPNPFVVSAVKNSGIENSSNIFITNAISYKNLVFLLSKSDWVVTDSGGVQEEVVNMGKMAIVLRDFTEREEGIWEGLTTLVGTNEDLIFKEMERLRLKNLRHKKTNNIFGDGNSSSRITMIIQSKLNDFSEKKGLAFDII